MGRPRPAVLNTPKFSHVLAQAKGGLRALRQTGAPTNAAARHSLRVHACSHLQPTFSTSPSPDHAAHTPAQFPHTPGMSQVTGADERWQQADGQYVHKACGMYQKIHFGV